MKRQDWIFALAVAVLVLQLGLLWRPVTRLPLRGDDFNFLEAARAFMSGGKASYSYGVGPWKQVALWHPPLIHAYHGLWLLLPVEPSISMRIAGLFSWIVTAILCWITGRYLWGREAGAISAILFLLLPLPASWTLSPDIDNNLLTPIAAALVLVLTMGLREKEGRWWLPSVTALLVAALLGAKWTTPVLLVPFLVLVVLLLAGPRVAWKLALRPFMFGTALFAFLYLAWAAWAGENPFYPLEFTVLAKGSSLAGTTGLADRLKSTGIVLAVVSPGLLALATMGIGGTGKPGLLLAFASILPLIAYSILLPGVYWHPISWKYVLPALPLLAILGGRALARSAVLTGKGAGVRVAAFVLATVLASLVMARIDFASSAPRLWKWGLGMTAILGVAALAWRRNPRLLSAVVGGVLVGQVLVMDWRFLQKPVAPSFPTVEVGTHDAWEKITRLPSGCVVVCRKDLGQVVPGGRFVPMEIWWKRPAGSLDVALGPERSLAGQLMRFWPFGIRDDYLHRSYERLYPDDLAALAEWVGRRATHVVDQKWAPLFGVPGMARYRGLYRIEWEIGDYILYTRRKGAG